jgi:hypothetical protein
MLVVLSVVTALVLTTVAPASAATTVWDEDFHLFTVGQTFADGQDIAPPGGTARLQDVFNGFGSQQITGSTTKYLRLAPKVSTTAGETHAALALSKAGLSGSFQLLQEFGNEAQLRTGSAPNGWERAWTIWNYQGLNAFVYLILKSNGWELGKEITNPDGSQGQCFLATGSSPTYTLGSWKRVVVTQTVNAAGQPTWVVQARTGSNALTTLTTFTDDGWCGAAPLTSGRAGIYAEDARVDLGWTRGTQN